MAINEILLNKFLGTSTENLTQDVGEITYGLSKLRKPKKQPVTKIKKRTPRVNTEHIFSRGY